MLRVLHRNSSIRMVMITVWGVVPAGTGLIGFKKMSIPRRFELRDLPTNQDHTRSRL